MNDNELENKQPVKVTLQTKDHHILIKWENVQLLNYWLNKLLFHIQNQTDVPFQFVQYFLELLTDPESYADNILRVEADKLAKEVTSRLSKNKDYKFKWKPFKQIIDGKEVEIKLTDEEVYYECIYSFFRYKNNLPKDLELRKERVIKFFYEILTDSYRDKIFRSYQNGFTHYRIGVISGILCMTVGTSITSGKDGKKMKNKEVFGAVDKIIEPYLNPNKKP